MFSQKNNTAVEQEKLEKKLQAIYKEAEELISEGESKGESIAKGELQKKAHSKYMFGFLRKFRLGPALETHRTWMLFFLLLGLETMNVDGFTVSSLTEFDKLELVEYVSLYWDEKSKIESCRWWIWKQFRLSTSFGNLLPSNFGNISSRVPRSLRYCGQAAFQKIHPFMQK